MLESRPLLIESDESEALIRRRKRKREFFIFSACLAALLLAANLLYGVFLHSRHDRSACLGCHRANTPAALWEQAHAHSPGFACSPCHGLPPGRQGGRCGAFSAHPDTVNPNCIGCHPLAVAGRPIPRLVEVRVPSYLEGIEEERVYQWPLQDLMYTWHVRNRVCLCTDCHRNIAHDRRGQAFSGNRPRMDACRQCHYHAAKDDYVNIEPLPRLEALSATVRPSPDPADPKDEAALDAPAGKAAIYRIPSHPYHRKGESLVRATGKDCRECHPASLYPQGDFFGWEFRKKWQLHWLLFSVAAFFMFAGSYLSVQFWRRGKRSSLHHPVHWPSVSRGLLDQAILGKRVYRHSRLRWAIFFAISVAFLALTAVFLLTLVFRFLLPEGNPFTETGRLVLDFLADLLGGVVTVGVLLALFRRTLGKTPSLKSEPEDFVILLLLLAIALTGFLLEACRLAVVAPEPRVWASFLGAALASVLRAWELPWTAVRFYGWVLHAALVFAFLAYLPFSKLFHLITSPISIAATASEAHYRQQQ